MKKLNVFTTSLLALLIVSSIFLMSSSKVYQPNEQDIAALSMELTEMKAELTEIKTGSEAVSMEPFVGEIKLFTGNFAPRGWTLCDGRLLSIAKFQALFSILGTTFGGDGRSTFALPDLRGRVPVGAGNGPGLNNFKLGEKGGAESATLSSQNLPNIPFGKGTWPYLNLSNTPGESTGGHVVAGSPDGDQGAIQLHMNSFVGASLPFSVKDPYVGMNYIIAIEGVFPSRG